MQEFWRYGEAVNTAKDVAPRDVFPPETDGAQDARYDPQLLVEETDAWMEHLIQRRLNDDFLGALLTNSEALVRDETAIFYNMISESETPELVTLPHEQRQGILMQPAWLVAFSEPDHNSPIRRGLFIQESLLCGEVPDIPIEGVPPLEIRPKHRCESRSLIVMWTPEADVWRAIG